jgi:hypothetical protein
MWDKFTEGRNIEIDADKHGRLLAQPHGKLGVSVSQAMCKYLPYKSVCILSNGLAGSIIVRVQVTPFFPISTLGKVVSPSRHDHIL